MTPFEVLKNSLGKRLVEIDENTVIEQHRTLKEGQTEETSEGKNCVHCVLVFDDGTRVILK